MHPSLPVKNLKELVAYVHANKDKAKAKIFEGPGPRRGGRRKMGSSVYVRDPDGNLLEFMIYS